MLDLRFQPCGSIKYQEYVGKRPVGVISANDSGNYKKEPAGYNLWRTIGAKIQLF